MSLYLYQCKNIQKISSKLNRQNNFMTQSLCSMDSSAKNENAVMSLKTSVILFILQNTKENILNCFCLHTESHWTLLTFTVNVNCSKCASQMCSLIFHKGLESHKCEYILTEVSFLKNYPYKSSSIADYKTQTSKL